ncbi:MAG: hypothetical protein K2K93_01120 [Muribaculaceae bacterium]|nr:hypothetical protein [Muribaculaceae bacterium]
MKKFLLSMAAAAFAGSAFAAEAVLAETDFSTATGYTFWKSDVTNAELKDGGLTITNAAATENFWDIQYMVADGMSVKEGTEYTVSLKIKGFSGSLHYVMGAWGNDVFAGAAEVAENADWQTVTFKGSAPADVEGGVHLLLQSGEFVGSYTIASVKITYNEEGGEVSEGKTLDMLPSLSNADYNADTKTITFGAAWGWVNWWFGEGDYSDYDSFVLEFEPVSYIVQVMIQYNEGDDVPVQAQPGESKIVVPLDADRKKSIKQIAIQNSEPGTLTLTAAYFAASAGVNAISATAVATGVYNMQGVKVADSLDEVTAPGLYISNGKKIVKK